MKLRNLISTILLLLAAVGVGSAEAYSEVNRRKFGGKELMSDHGYNSYDFAARYLTTGFPVFTTSDLLQERHYPISAYAYCSNNPINCSDPTGLDWVEVNNSLLTRSDFVGTNLLPVNTMSQVQRYSYRPTNFFVEEVLA